MATRNTKCVISIYRNYKILLKNKKDMNKRNNIPCTRMGRLGIEKKSIPFKLFHRFNKIPVKFLVEASVCENVYVYALVGMCVVRVNKYFCRG